MLTPHPVLTRRTVLTAVLAPMVVLPLAGCGFERMLQGPDREEFTAQLQRAASSAPLSASSDEIPTIATNSKGVLDQDHPEVSTDDLLEYFNLR